MNIIPRIYRIEVKIENPAFFSVIHRTFEFVSQDEAQEFFDFCVEHDIGTVITTRSPYTCKRALNSLRRELELAAEGRVA